MLGCRRLYPEIRSETKTRELQLIEENTGREQRELNRRPFGSEQKAVC